MEQWKETLFGGKSAGPVRKLQKSVTKQRSCNLGKHFRPSISRPVATATICDTQDDKLKFLKPRRLSSAALGPSDPRPPDFPSTTHKRFYERDPPFPPLEQLGNPAPMFSELTDLLPNKLQRRHSSIQIRRAFSISKMKPRRKTPLLSIVPVEDAPQKSRPGRDRTRTSSVDLIAEQYRTLLEFRPEPMHPDTDSQQEDGNNGELLATATTTERRRSASYYLAEESPLDPSLEYAELQDISPRSENDTLVSFEDEAVYFKPVSFSPEPPSQVPYPPSPRKTTRHLTPSSFPSVPSVDNNMNVSLQICLDLLTRELSTAIGGSQPASHSSSSSASEKNTGMSALQVWAMIEAYERLRDQLAAIGAPTATTSRRRKDNDDEDRRRAREMERMFDMWLRALYSIHDSLTR